MRKHMRGNGVPVGKDAKAEAVALDDGWVWGVIFATTDARGVGSGHALHCRHRLTLEALPWPCGLG